MFKDRLKRLVYDQYPCSRPVSSSDRSVSPDDKYRTSILKDAKGFACSRCRQRFPVDINVSEIQCPGCQRSQSERIANCYGSTIQRPLNKGTARKFKSLNCNPLEPRARSIRPRKRALLVGVTYAGTIYKLECTVSDVKNMRNFLMENFGFQKQDILILTEEETKPYYIPTKKNIQESLNWLVEDCREGDSLVFYYAGHGFRLPDFKYDELDGYDETICPVDFMEEGMILDNDINSTIVWPLPKGVTLHAIVDACHSGTILDLVHVYDREKRQWRDNSPPNGARKHTNGGLAISISACEDNQMATETSAFGGKGMNGVLTYILIEIAKRHVQPTYGDLIDMIHETIDEINRSGSLPVRMIRSMLHSKLLQKPLLSASQPFHVWNKHFIL